MKNINVLYTCKFSNETEWYWIETEWYWNETEWYWNETNWYWNETGWCWNETHLYIDLEVLTVLSIDICIDHSGDGTRENPSRGVPWVEE